MRTANLTIDDIAFGGKGVGRDQGKVVFVPYTIDGETISAEIVREKKQFAEGELVEIREKSPHRVTPPCPYFGRCGGCAYQHIDYEHQLGIKWRQVRDVLQRIGKISDPPMRPIIPSPVDYGYRNRITIHALDGVIGFFRRESNQLIDIKQCPISSDEVNQQLQQLRESAPRDGHYTLRSEKGARIFSQTNDAVAERLRELVVSLIPSDRELLIDAYCGAGFFAKALLDKCHQIIGIDWDQFAIEEARKKATPKEIYIAGDVEEKLEKIWSGNLQSGIGFQPMIFRTSAGSRYHTADRRSLAVIVDPPATGLTNRVRDAISSLKPETLVYVSCNPATLARDLKDLTRSFTIESVTPLDMFPQTAEIEVVVSLQQGS